MWLVEMYNESEIEVIIQNYKLNTYFFFLETNYTFILGY